MHGPRPLGLLAAVALLLAPAPVAAHPHVWIDMRSTVLLDEQGRVGGVRIGWLFDRFYSSYAEQDLDGDRSGSVSDAEAQTWAETALANIAGSGYFAEWLIDGQSSAPTKADTPVGRWIDGQLFMSFVIRPDAPLDPRKAAIGYLVYDPQFYIDIRHPDGADFAAVEGTGQESCGVTVGRSEPPPEVVASASALDRNATAPSGLGRLFADYVKVACR